MLVIFCAFGSEYGPLRARLHNPVDLGAGLRGARGELGGRAATIVVSGVGVRRARETASRAFATLPEVDRVILTGVAGALHADLKIGGVVIGERLTLRRELEFVAASTIAVAPQQVEMLAAALRRRGIGHMRGTILTSRRAIATAADKTRAQSAFEAIAVDMESAVIAEEAAWRRVPFICVRAIMDTAAQNLEGAMLADDDGRVRVMQAARVLLGNPRMIGASIRLMRNLRVAAATMADAVEAVAAHRD